MHRINVQACFGIDLFLQITIFVSSAKKIRRNQSADFWILDSDRTAELSKLAYIRSLYGLVALCDHVVHIIFGNTIALILQFPLFFLDIEEKRGNIGLDINAHFPQSVFVLPEGEFFYRTFD